MSTAHLQNATDRLSPTAVVALAAANEACVKRTNYKIEPEHWLLALLRMDGGDLQRVARHFGVDPDALDEQLNAAIDNFRRGDGSRRPDFSPQTSEMLEQAAVAASMRGATAIRGGHLLLGLTQRSRLWQMFVRDCPALARVKPAALESAFVEIVGPSEEDAAAADAPPPPAGGDASSAAGPAKGPPGAAPAAGGGKRTALDRFTTDLTALAAAGKIDPPIGRDAEIDQCVQALSRRKQNNPILVGDPGVGKTAIVEGLARLMVEGKIQSPLLKDAVLRSLDLGALQAGAGVRGEFEERLRSLVAEIKAHPRPVVLFIDEAHMLLGAGGAEGQGDAANMLKPALARGELRAIAATTWAEYKKYFEKDAALARRFDLVKVGEPDEPTACHMIRGTLGSLERHHGVRVLNEAVVSAVRLSKRYMPGRQLPDKAVSLLDTACTAVALSTSVLPPAIQDCRRRIDDAAHALRMIRRERSSGHGADAHAHEDADRLAAKQAEAERELADLESRYARERDIVLEVRSAWDAAADDAAPAADREAAKAKVTALRRQLRAHQGDAPLAHALVDGPAVADVVARWTGIPLGRMNQDEMQAVLSLEDRLGERVVGQGHAMAAIAETIRKSRAGLTDPVKPVGVFLMLGTSGVGKTETAVALADLLFGGPAQLTTINMSEFKEDSKVSQLLGASAGYVGFGQGGVLTEAVRRKPYSVLLLDEMEKANRAVQDIFLSAFDKGVLRDGEGRDIDFRNTLIVLTSNAASMAIAELCAGDARPDPEEMLAEVQPILLQHFRPEFVGRTTPIVYYPLSKADLRRVVELQLKRVAQRLQANHNADLAWDEAVIAHVVDQCNDRSAGARVIDRVLNRHLLPKLSSRVLARVAEGERFRTVTLAVADGTIDATVA